MILNRFLLKLLLIFVIATSINASIHKGEPISLNFNNLEIEDFIKFTSKIIGKNILITKNIRGKVNFIANRPIYKDDLEKILQYVLEEKGYTLIDNNNILRVVRIHDASKFNLPVVSSDTKYDQMITQIIPIDYDDVDFLSSKIRHLLSKSGKLVTNKHTNTIAITDFSDNINTIKKVLQLIKRDSKRVTKTINLKYAKATKLKTQLISIAKNMFNNDSVKIIANDDINTLMIIGKKKLVNKLAYRAKMIDKKSKSVENIVKLIYLKNAEAKNVLKVLKDIIDKRQYPNKAKKPYASTDEESNSIIVMGPKEEINYLQTLIKQLDHDKQQVYVVIKIIEVSSNKISNIGAQYGLQGLKTNSSGLTTFAAKFAKSDVSIALPSGLTGETVKDGLALSASINFFKQHGAVDIVSEPSILCVNNKESSIYAGVTKSIPSGTTITSGGNSTTNYKREDIGLRLKVKPRISSKDKVTLEISTTLEDVSETKTNEQPDTTKKEVVTTAIVRNAETIILGGLIKNKTGHTLDKVPLLGDIPVFGSLFKNNNEINDKIKLLIVVTPYIIPKSENLTTIRSKLSELKMIEDKVTKNLELRLQKIKLQTQKDDLKRDKEKFDLIQDLNDVQDDIKDNNKQKQKYIKKYPNIAPKILYQ